MSGAYLLTDASGEALYAGASRNVERRIREHRRCEWGGEIAHVETFPSADWRSALRIERCLIADLNPRHNQQSFDPLDRARTLAEFAAALGVEVGA